MNKVFLHGYLGSNPELRDTQYGKVCSFRVATSEYLGKDKAPGTEWHRCTTWDALAERCYKNLVKGSEIICEGKIQTKAYKTEAGDRRYSTSVIVRYVEYVGKKRTEPAETIDPNDVDAAAGPPPPEPVPEGEEDNVPF